MLDWVGLPVTDSSGDTVGTCTAVYADDATGLPEWALVQGGRDSGLRFLPLVDARTEGGSLRVAVDSERIESAPRVGSQGHLTEAEEAVLYEHYGVPYSAGPSDTLLPASVDEASTEALGETAAVEPLSGSTPETQDVPAATMPPMEPEPMPVPEPLVPAPTPEPLVPSPPPQPLQPEPAPQPLPEASVSPASPAPEPRAVKPPAPAPTGVKPPAVKPAGGRGVPAEGMVAATAGACAALWLLWRERQRPAPKSSARTSLRRAGYKAVRTARPLGAVAADVAHRPTRAVGSAAESARGAAANSGRTVRRSWRRTATRAIALGSVGSGYVLGARAGQRRYEELRASAGQIRERLRPR